MSQRQSEPFLNCFASRLNFPGDGRRYAAERCVTIAVDPLDLGF